MSAIRIFTAELKESVGDFKKHFPLFLPSIIFMLILCNLSFIPWEILGFESGSNVEIITGLFIGILAMVVSVHVILIEKSRLLGSPKEKLAYGAASYIVYTLYSSLIVLLGIVLLIIPGFLALIFFSLAPVVALLSRDQKEGYLKQSINLVKKNTGLVVCYLGASMGVEIVSILLDLIDNWKMRVTIGIFYSFFEAFATVILTIFSVRLFYYLNRLPSK